MNILKIRKGMIFKAGDTFHGTKVVDASVAREFEFQRDHLLETLKICKKALAPLVEDDPHPLALEAFEAAVDAIKFIQGQK